MSTILKIRTLVFSFIVFNGCAEFIEYPLENKQIDLLAPSVDYQSNDTLVTFWWSVHEDAKYYRLQIVQPTFEKTDILYLDTLLSEDKLVVDLDPGQYEWRVRPENNGSVGQYQQRTIQVHPKP